MVKNDVDMYRIERFTIEKLETLNKNVQLYAHSMGGLPQNHNDVYSKKGWLLPYLLAYDELLWGRWNYWFEILQKETIRDSGPIPQILWSDLGSSGVNNAKKMLHQCLEHHDSTIEKFADWLLWGYGALPEAPRISTGLNEHYYRKFDLFLLLDNPTDYLSNVLCDETGKGYKAGLGYYPTPFNVTLMMTQMLITDDLETMKRNKVSDSCVGCGATLLPMSNYSLRAYGQDISQIAIKLCKIQFFWFAPWFALPGSNIGGFDKNEIDGVIPMLSEVFI